MPTAESTGLEHLIAHLIDLHLFTCKPVVHFSNSVTLLNMISSVMSPTQS